MMKIMAEPITIGPITTGPLRWNGDWLLFREANRNTGEMDVRINGKAVRSRIVSPEGRPLTAGDIVPGAVVRIRPPEA